MTFLPHHETFLSRLNQRDVVAILTFKPYVNLEDS